MKSIPLWVILPLSMHSYAQVSIKVDPNQVLNTIPYHLYGSCIEDVNHEIYGGLYDQRLYGESFEEPAIDGVSNMWKPIGKGVFSPDSIQAYNGRKCQVIESGGIYNQGLNHWGIAVQKGHAFSGSIYLKGNQPATIALQSADGSRTYATTTTGPVTANWQKHTFRLTPQATDSNARFAIYLTHPGKLYLDQATLMSTDQFKGLPLRKDISTKMQEEGLRFLRYGGTMVNAPEYRWKKMIGPRDKRPPYKGHWYPYSSNGFGIIDFLDFCKAANFEAAFAINIEETAADAADLITYLHRGAYKVKYIEIGNEEVLFDGDRADQYDHYMERFNELYTAIHSKDTSIKLVCSVWWRPDSPNSERLFKAIDGKAAYWDLHVGGDDPREGIKVDKDLTQMEALFKKWNPNTTMKCAIFEENGGTHNQQRAVGHASVLNAVRRHGDFVLTSCAANALQPLGQNDNGWDQGQIFFTPASVWGAPPFYATKIAAANHQPLLCAVTTDTLLDVTATRSEDGKTIVLHIVNAFNTPCNAQINLQGKVKVYQLANAVLTESSSNGNTFTFPPFSYTIIRYEANTRIHPLALTKVSINDPFWSPKLAIWSRKTVYDVLNKLEGDYTPDREDLIKEKQQLGHTRNAFNNFDRVAQGKKDIGIHDGPPWYDGLVYESIRGAADIMVQYPDAALEKKLDSYITRIAAAQAVDPDGYINTYTTLMNANKRWQNERWQHDLYNAGMLVDAGIHYYNATGKTTLLKVGIKMADYIYTQMGPAPKQNIIPGHGGPEEAFIKLYELLTAHPELAKDAHPDHYLSTALFWITDRGHYNNPDGSQRESYGAYNQDQSPVFDQQTIEGHAVRATLLATGITSAALLNHDPAYIKTADNYWNNMAGKRTFITGGQGAIPEDEKFGPDYYLPESAYLETCAAVSAAFFSEKMNELKEEGKYMDEFERVIYNNLLAGVSQDGTHYFYENPLTATHRSRWTWHDCPCCPPMFLKMIGVLPQYIYGESEDAAYVNLFISSKAQFTSLSLEQTTSYPAKGHIQLKITSGANIPIRIRIPGWATGKENPFDLYTTTLKDNIHIKINNKAIAVVPANGYISLSQAWKKGDIIDIDLPVAQRWVYPNPNIKALQGKAAVAAGPVVYAKEGEHLIPFYLVANGDSTLPYSVWQQKR